MASFPVQVLLGIYLGLLTGILPSLVAWTLGFVFKYVTGISAPAFGVIVLSLAIAGASGGLLALNDPTIKGAPNSITLTTAILVVLMVSIYAHARGDQLGATMPKRLSLRSLSRRTLSSDVVDLVGGNGQVRITVTGEVDDVEGYPPIPSDLRSKIGAEEWQFPADLPLAELETRLADALRTEFDLADVSVHIDERGRASIAAAPPTGGVSKRVPAGKRAASVEALLPTGLGRGDEVEIHADGEPIRADVVSAGSTATAATSVAGESGVETDGGVDSAAEATEPTPPRRPTTDGGDGRLTVAVSREEATRLLGASRPQVVVRSRGHRREFELLSLLRRAGKRFRKLSIGQGSSLAGSTIGTAAIRDTYGVGVFAVRQPSGWTLAPSGDTPLEGGDELFVVGTRENLDRFAEVAA